jgi:hypothetical protein
MNWQGCSMRRAVYEKIATTYLRDARYCYLRWGADAKVRQLEQLYPQIRVDKIDLGCDGNDTHAGRATRSGDCDQGVRSCVG